MPSFRPTSVPGVAIPDAIASKTANFLTIFLISNANIPTSEHLKLAFLSFLNVNIRVDCQIPNCSSTCISILSCIPEVLLRQPFLFFDSLRDVDPLNLEDDRPRTIVAAGDHHAVVICPAFQISVARAPHPQGLACRLGRCFGFAESSTGRPHPRAPRDRWILWDSNPGPSGYEPEALTN